MLTAVLLLTSCVTSVSHNCRYGPTVVQVRYEVTSTRRDCRHRGGGRRGRGRSLSTGSDALARLTERVRGDSFVRLRARNIRPLGTVSAAIYVDDVLWKKETGVGSGTVETKGVIESESGWDCGYAVFMQTWPAKSEQSEEPIGDPAIGGR